jgi:acyl carrier protein
MTERIRATDIIDAVATALRVKASTLSATTTSDDVPEWDSLGHLRVCLALEERFGVTIDMERMPDLTSVASMVAYLDAHR